MSRFWCLPLLAVLIVAPLPAADNSPDAEGGGLPLENRYSSHFDVAREQIEKRNWSIALTLLQKLLDLEEDEFVAVRQWGPDSKPARKGVSLRREASRILAGLPAEGRAAYQQEYGPIAAEMLREAIADNDERLLAQITRRFACTEAGVEAARRLAAYLSKEIEKRGTPAERRKWLTYRGDSARAAHSVGGIPLLEPIWKRDVCTEKFTRDEYLAKAAGALREAREPLLPASHPLLFVLPSDNGDLISVAHRSHWGLHIRPVLREEDKESGKDFVEWEAPLTWSLDRMIREPRVVGSLNEWVRHYLGKGARPGILFENTLIGTLSTDNRHLFTIDDLPVPPYTPLAFNRFGQPGLDGPGGSLGDAKRGNRLEAFDLESGKLIWEAGSMLGEKDPLRESYFLSVPLPLEGKLLVLNEKDQVVRLLALEPRTGQVLRTHPLARLAVPFREVLERQLDAVHLAHADNMLVCPTHSGVVFGIDTRTERMRWVFPYESRVLKKRDQKDDPVWKPEASRRWRNSVPILVRGRVLIAPPDADRLWCLHLHDGQVAWETARLGDDLYIAGVLDEVVFIVGRTSCRGLRLVDGKELWHVRTGLPSGQGAMARGRFFLPLAEETRSRQPGILVLGSGGRILAHVRSSKKDTPGNLYCTGNILLSQTATELVAYALAEPERKRREALLKTAPGNVSSRKRLALLKRDAGDLKGAIHDLNAILISEPPEPLASEARAHLLDTLLELFERDFNGGSAFLKLFVDRLGERPPLERVVESGWTERRSRYLLAVAMGREQQGNRVEAIRHCLELAVLGRPDLLPVPGDPERKVAAHVLARWRIEALYQGASVEARKEIEHELGAWLVKARTQEDSTLLSVFSAVVGPGLAQGRDARRELAERLVQNRDFVGAERLLLEVRRQRQDLTAAGQALERLARLSVRAGLPEDAAVLYRELAHEFATIKVRDGKTGKELFEEPRIDQGGNGKRLGEIVTMPGYLGLAPAGPVLPSFERLRFFLGEGEDLNRFRILNRETGREHWGQHLPVRAATHLDFHKGYQPGKARLRYQTLGHLTLVAADNLLLALDPVGKRILWQRTVADPLRNQHQLDGNSTDGTVRIVYEDGWVQRLKPGGLASPSAVILHTREGLSGLDPLTGRTLWQRADLSGELDLIQDGEQLLVVELDRQRAVRTWTLDLSTGQDLKATDVSGLYQRRLRLDGRVVLAAEPDEDGRLTLRRHDLITRKDLWQTSFSAGSMVLATEEAGLAGAVQPDGTVRVHDAGTGKVVFTSQMKPDAVRDVESVHLLRDRGAFYLACARPAERDVQLYVQTMGSDEGRTVRLNGALCCFEPGGKLRWQVEVPYQTIFLNRFSDLPAIVCGAIVQRAPLTDKDRSRWTNRLHVIDKQSGKSLHDEDWKDYPYRRKIDVCLDDKGGAIEVIGPNDKVSIPLKAPKK